MSTPEEARRVVGSLNNQRIGEDTIQAQISHDRPDENYSEQRKNIQARPPHEGRPHPHPHDRRAPPVDYPPRHDHRYPQGAAAAAPPHSPPSGPTPFRGGEDRRGPGPLPPHDPYYPRPDPRGPDPRDARAAERFDPRYPPRSYYPPPRDYYPPPGGHHGRDRDRGYYDPYYPYPPRYDAPPYGYPPRYDDPRDRRRDGDRYGSMPRDPRDSRDFRDADRREGRRDERRDRDRDRSRRPERPPPTCYNCNRPNHTSRECPLPPTQPDQCFYCRNIGHQYKECPSRGVEIPLESLEGFDPHRTDQPTTRPGGTKAERRRAAAQKKAEERDAQEGAPAETNAGEGHAEDRSGENDGARAGAQEHGDRDAESDHQDEGRAAGGDDYDDQRGDNNYGDVYGEQGDSFYDGQSNDQQNDGYDTYQDNEQPF